MGQGILVKVLPSTFNQTTTNVLVPTLTGVLTAMASNNDPNLQLGPFTAGDPETELLRTRHAVLVPSEYVGLILAHGDGMTPRAFFDEVYPLLQTDGNEVACLALTNFVRMAMTLSTGPNNNPTMGIPRPIPAPRNVNLLTYSSQLLHHSVSTLNIVPTAPAIDLTPVLNHLNQHHATKEAWFIQAETTKAAK